MRSSPRPPRERVLRHGRAQRQKRRHDDGADAARRADDGDPQRWIDPAIIGHVADATGKSTKEILDVLNKKSTLLEVSGISNDMRTVEEAKGDERARLALDLFCYVLAKAIAGLVVPLGRLDALVFTGGIGENSATVRAITAERQGFLGLTLDAAANATHGRTQNGRITTGTRPQALVVLATNSRESSGLTHVEVFP